MTNFLAELAALPVVERLGWTLIHFVWQAMIVSVVVAIALRVFRKAAANTRYVGLCGALLVVAALPAVTFVALAVDENAIGSAGVVPVSRVSSSAEPVLRRGLDHDVIYVNHGSNVTEEAEAGGIAAVHAPVVFDFQGSVNSAVPWIVVLWVLGVELLSVWHTVGWMLARRLTIRGTRPVAAAVQSMFDSLTRRMGIRASVRLLESTATSVPILVGWLKPVVLIPASVLCRLPPEQLQAILAHELAHVRRHDYLVNVLQTVVETCLFYHPAVWWLSRQVRIEREYCADEEAAALCVDRDTYARALVSLADSVMAVPHPATVAATGGLLTRRIQRILGLQAGNERLARQPSWLVSASLGLTLICGLFASTQSNAQVADQARIETTPIKEAVDRLVAGNQGWKLLQVDERPSITVDGYRGYRVVLRRTWKEFTDPIPQQVRPDAERGPFELRHEDWEFVLMAVQPKPVPPALRRQIKWQKSTSPYHTQDVCLGEGLGYTWFTRGTLFGQDYARESLKLDGGDDRIQLAMDGLLVDDPGTMTGNTCLYIPAKFGDRALPYIERTIERVSAGEDRLWRVIGSLAYIDTDRSTELLLKLFDSETNEIRRAAQYALIHQPFRKGGKRAYLDMLRRQSSLQEACRACVQFQWREAVPILHEIIARPQHLRELTYTIPARRTLEGNPIAPALLEAELTMRKLTSQQRTPELQRQIDAARRLLIQTDDTEAANLAALSLATATSKGGVVPVNEGGLEILRSRARESTLAFLKSLAEGIHEDERPRIENVLQAVESAGR